MKTQHLSAIFFFLVIWSSPALFSQSKAHRQIAQLELRRFEAMTQKDIPFLEKVLSDKLTYSHSNGLVETKSEHLENIRSGGIVYQQLEPEKNNIKVFGRTAVVHGIVRVRGIFKKKHFKIRLAYTDVYIKRKGKWRLVAWQSTKL